LQTQGLRLLINKGYLTIKVWKTYKTDMRGLLGFSLLTFCLLVNARDTDNLSPTVSPLSDVFPDSNDETAPPSSSDLSSKNSNNDWLTDDDDDDDEENLDEGLRLNAQAVTKPTKKPTAAPLTNSK